MGEVLYLQDRDHPDQRDHVVRAENIRSPMDVTIGITGGNLILHPLGPTTSTLWVELPGGPAAAGVIGGVVNLIYDPGVTTNAVMAAAVLADLASSVQLSILGDAAAVIPAGLVPAAHNLWSTLVGVPEAAFRFNQATGLWEPWDGSVTLAAAAMAALLPDNRIASQTIDLGVGPRVDVALGLAGRNLNVLGMTGAASIRLVNGGVPYPTLPALAMNIFQLDRFNFDFTDVLLSNVVQPGLSLTLAAMWRV